MRGSLPRGVRFTVPMVRDVVFVRYPVEVSPPEGTIAFVSDGNRPLDDGSKSRPRGQSGVRVQGDRRINANTPSPWRCGISSASFHRGVEHMKDKTVVDLAEYSRAKHAPAWAAALCGMIQYVDDLAADALRVTDGDVGRAISVLETAIDMIKAEHGMGPPLPDSVRSYRNLVVP